MGKLLLVFALLGPVVCEATADDENRDLDIVGEFVTKYHQSPAPALVPKFLDLLLKSNALNDESATDIALLAQAFGYMAREKPNLVRLYQSRFEGAPDNGKKFLLQALGVCGDDTTQRQLRKWSLEREYRKHKKQLLTIDSILADPKRKFPRDRPAESPHDLDLLWADYFITGEYPPISRILDVLDRTGNLRQQVRAWMKSNPGNGDEMLEILRRYKLIQPGMKDQLIVGDLELAFLHDPRGRIKPGALESAGYIEKEILKLTDQGLSEGLLFVGAASWSLQDNIKQHKELADLLKNHLNDRPAKSQDLLKRWLRIGQFKIVLDKDAKKLQGAWQATNWENDEGMDDPKLRTESLKYVRWTFDEDEVTMTRAFTLTECGKTVVKGQGGQDIATYTIDLTKNPKQIVFTTISREDGLVFSAIYNLDGDVLRVCMSKDNRMPKEFSTNDGCILLTLKRIRDN